MNTITDAPQPLPDKSASRTTDTGRRAFSHHFGSPFASIADMAVPEQPPSDRLSAGFDNLTEGTACPADLEMDAKRNAAINDETRAAIENASALTERAAIELADLERRITEFRERLGRDPR